MRVDYSIYEQQVAALVQKSYRRNDQTHQRYATPVIVDLVAPDADAPLRTIRDVLDPAAEGYDMATYFAESNGS